MFRNRLYYHLKPLLPPSARMAIRRWFAMRKRDSVLDKWPILPGSEKPPANWPGWPDGKQFAFVLTHDVEGPEGMAKVRKLAELEMQLGFRSCFNFIPEGDYAVPSTLRTWLVENGFEVGVHDLYHDGKLFLTEKEFRRNVPRINHYLKEWGAVGFRSGFMLSELDWLHDLDIQYDCSTFDTDPFEPQPDGVSTIFPFWVPRSSNAVPGSEFPIPSSGSPVQGSGLPPSDSPTPPLHHSTTPLSSGYVELPYTLPQDSTLFLLFRERHPDIWFQKLDWIAKHGGMALLNVHPDYLRFEGEPASSRTYPVDHYARFLRYALERHGTTFWNALPRDVAQFVRSSDFRPKAVPPKSHPTRGRPKIWIDLDNTPHVPFFEPIIDELRSRGFPLLVTARDAFQVCDLADTKRLAYIKVGRHYGKNRLAKGAGLAYRALQLAPFVMREKPSLCVSHGARSQLILGNLLRLTTLLIEDYEYCEFPFIMRPAWLMTPSVIPDSCLCKHNGHVLKYQGIKEDVYAWKLQPDIGPIRELGVIDGELVITVRPPATEAHYHNPESELLFENFMNRACAAPGTRIILLPRNQKQADWIRSGWPQWFQGNKTIIPKRALDGMNLIWHSDLVVSGGGTMNREAAALGVPVYSIFRGTVGAVDRHLQAEGRLVLVESVEDVARKIALVKRTRKPLAEVTSKQTLHHIVNTIEQLAEECRP